MSFTICSCICGNVSLSMITALKCACRVVTVSYTHLDVYKRQVYSSATKVFVIDLKKVGSKVVYKRLYRIKFGLAIKVLI